MSRITGDVVTLAATLRCWCARPVTSTARRWPWSPAAWCRRGCCSAAWRARGVRLRAAPIAPVSARCSPAGAGSWSSPCSACCSTTSTCSSCAYLIGEAAAGKYAAAYVLISFCANLRSRIAHRAAGAGRETRPPTAATAATYASALVTACLVTMPVAIGGALIAPLIVDLVFGAPYAEAPWPCACWCSPCRSAPCAKWRWRRSSRATRSSALLRVNIVAAVVNVWLILALVPAYGLAGAAGSHGAQRGVRSVRGARGRGRGDPDALAHGRLARCRRRAREWARPSCCSALAVVAGGGRWRRGLSRAARRVRSGVAHRPSPHPPRRRVGAGRSPGATPVPRRSWRVGVVAPRTSGHHGARTRGHLAVAAGRGRHRLVLRRGAARVRTADLQRRRRVALGLVRGSAPTPSTPRLVDAAARALPRLHSLLVSQRGAACLRALLQRRPRATAGQHQVGVEERHLGAGRHRHRARADPERRDADRHLLPRARQRPRPAQARRSPSRIC